MVQLDPGSLTSNCKMLTNSHLQFTCKSPTSRRVSELAKSTLNIRLLFAYTCNRVQSSANSAVRFHDPLQEVR